MRASEIHLHILRKTSLEVINDAESARLLLEAGAQLEALDDTGRTPLALAAAYGNLEPQMMYGEGFPPFQVREGILDQTLIMQHIWDILGCAYTL